MSANPTRKTIRFEDLGEPVQRLLKSLKGGVSEEDMALLEFVAVKDMKTIFEKMASETAAHEVWAELREALQTRKEKAERKDRELNNRQQDIDEQLAAQQKQEEEERLAAEAEEEARRLRKEERRRLREARQAEQDAADEEARLAEQEAAEEEARREAEEAEEKRRDAKKKRREARARELAEEQEALRLEQDKQNKARKKNQKKEWDDYVASHPLDFAPQVAEIKQVEVQRDVKAPPKADEDLLNRSYTPKCPNCFAKFSRPPPEWDCPVCFRRLRQKFKVWQPDADAAHCMCCKGDIGRFNRHHCRNCGRVVCSKCSENKAMIPSIGFKDTVVKVCQECVDELAKPVVQ